MLPYFCLYQYMLHSVTVRTLLKVLLSLTDVPGDAERLTESAESGKGTCRHKHTVMGQKPYLSCGQNESKGINSGKEDYPGLQGLTLPLQ